MSKYFLALFIAAFCWPVQALVLSPQMGLHEAASLSGHLAVLRDADGLKRIEDVAAPATAAKFAATPGFVSAGFTTATYWLRFTLQRTAPAADAWLLEVAPSYLDDVTLYVPRSDGSFEATHLGDLQPFSERPVPHRSFVFPVRLINEQPVTLYLRIQSSSTMLVQVQAWQYTGLLAQAQLDTSLYSIYFGILALGVMSNLMYWFWLRERIYLSYCGYLAMLAVVTIAVGGFAAQWGLANQPVLASRLVGVSVCLVYLLGTNFFVRALRLSEHFPITKRPFNLVMVFYALCALAAAVGWYGVVAPWMMLVFGVVNVVLVLSGPWLLWRGHREYLLYILAFAINLLALPFVVIKLMGWGAINVSTDHISMLGALIHIVLLHFAVVDRVRRSEGKMRVAVEQAAELAAERESVQRQRQFVAMVSHEFRTPLAVIDATAQSVEIACSQSSIALNEFIAPRQEKIRRSVRRLISLMDNFLTHERLDIQEIHSKGEKLDLRDLTRAAAKNWAHILQRPDQLQLELPEEAVTVFAEQAMLALALSNLIDNAIKYSPLGALIMLRVGKTQTDGWIEVEDCGVGVSQSEVENIFDKFYRSGDAQSVPGAGLGLHLVRTIARNQGGEVGVESTPGKGSRFRLRLKLIE
jgi:signal transduction histidine kinase